MSRRLFRIAAASLWLVPAMALADGPKFISTWKAPEASTTSFAGKKVAALIISDDQDLRVAGEEALVRELAELGLAQGVATYRMIPREELRDPEKAKGWYERAGVEGVVSMRLVSADVRKTWTPSMWVSSSYSTLWGYYPYSWGIGVRRRARQHAHGDARRHRNARVQRAGEQAAVGRDDGDHGPEGRRDGDRECGRHHRQGDDEAGIAPSAEVRSASTSHHRSACPARAPPDSSSSTASRR